MPLFTKRPGPFTALPTSRTSSPSSVSVASSATLTVALYVYANDRGRTDIAFSIASVLMLLTLVINLTAALTGRKLKKNGGTQ